MSVRAAVAVGALMGALWTIALAASLPPLSADPLSWLADIHGERALQWVTAHDEKSEALLKSDPAYQKDHDSILAALDSSDRLPLGRVDHGMIYNFWQDKDHVRGIWRRTTLAGFRKPNPEWDVLLDVDKLDAGERADYVWQGGDCAPDGEHCLVLLSPGGGDATTVRELDLRTKSFPAGGFALPLSKLTATYVDSDTVLVAADFGPASMTTSSYPRVVKLWRRGEPLSAARTIYEAKTSDVAARPVVYRGPYGTIALVQRGVTFFTNEYYALRPDGLVRKLPLPLGAELQGATQGDLIFTLRDSWMPVGARRIFPAGSLIAFPVSAFLSGKKPRFALLASPGPRSTIDSVSAGRDAVYAAIFTNVTGAIESFRPDAKGVWQAAKLALPSGGSTASVAADDWSADAQFTYESFLTPPTLYDYEGEEAPVPIKSQHALFDASRLVSEQLWTKSKDGTRIPYFLVRQKNARGPEPTLLWGYGGFEIAITPYYWNDGHRPLYPAESWLLKGGAIAIANLRGGGEFGPKWHQAALKFNRQRAYDDFEAIASDLEKRGVATPQMLGIVGASNGGLLVTAAMTQRPDLFRAVVCQRPLIDMLHYTEFGAGASWEGEYGDPADPRMRAYIAKYSPYQNVRPDTKYPDVLFITETSDDRVTPVWARMMAAKMESQGHNVLFHEAREGGHGPGSTNQAQAEMWALSYVFFAKELGLSAGLN